MRPSIVILIPYFGNWPSWIDFFVESCRSNRTIHWIIFSDAAEPENRAPNLRHIRMSFEDYKSHVSKALGTPVAAEAPYKLCDLRPALGVIHADLIRGYDFFGFGDLDVIYGDIRAFYDDATLSDYDLLSSHADRVSGHLCLMRNRKDMVTLFERAPGWKEALGQAEYANFDERGIYRYCRGAKAKLLGRIGLQQGRWLFREAYSTPAATNHMRWYWQDGRLTNEFYPHHPFMYLHLMSWHSSRWHVTQPHVAAGSQAPWARLPRIVQMDWRDARTDGFMISPDGIQPIELRPYP